MLVSSFSDLARLAADVVLRKANCYDLEALFKWILDACVLDDSDAFSGPTRQAICEDNLIRNATVFESPYTGHFWLI